MAEQGKGQQPLPLNETPEFKAAIAAAVAAEMAKLGPAAFGLTSGGTPDSAFAQSLALALAEFNEQGGGKKYVDPKILQARRAADDKMWELIVKAHKEGRTASYKLTHKVVLADELVEPFWIDTDHIAKPTIIDWAGPPNGAMIPVNDTAKEIHEQFRISVGSTERAALDSRPMGITAGGLVVHGGAVQKRRGDAGQLPRYGENVHDSIEKEQRESGLNVHHKRGSGQSAPVHILGPIAAPAQEITQSLGRG